MPYKSDIIGWMPESDLKVIEHISQSMPSNGIIVEVGSMFGRSSVCWALSAPTATVYCIDCFNTDFVHNTNADEQYNKTKHSHPAPNVKYNTKYEFQKNTKEISNIIMIEGESPNIDYPGKEIDIFFLDAQHINPNDWDNLCHFIPLIKTGGIVCGHDIPNGHDLNIFPDVMKNVKRLEKIFGVQVTTFKNTSIWMFKLPRKITKEELHNVED